MLGLLFLSGRGPWRGGTCDGGNSSRAAGCSPFATHGPGIPVEDQEHIFRRFWRRDRSKPASTGLGLPIVHRIVELHGGTITIVNGPGRGAQFLIQLRPAEAEEELADRPCLT